MHLACSKRLNEDLIFDGDTPQRTPVKSPPVVSPTLPLLSPAPSAPSLKPSMTVSKPSIAAKYTIRTIESCDLSFLVDQDTHSTPNSHVHRNSVFLPTIRAKRHKMNHRKLLAKIRDKLESDPRKPFLNFPI